ncbi:hypothetical protein [Nitrosophilus labii]|uniref:hypothetical protein n=1 Tax=Nitrosophilus labii TaxID=2706014 RepID=UPI001656E0CD|nr:hypothetical protein [Nitrosophilus labii]
MLYDILQEDEFSAILKNHATDLIRYFLEKDEPFGVLARTETLSFNPDIPKEIKETFAEFTLFLLVNYTLESAYTEDSKLIFEAGFGSENIGSVVTVPIESILQIIVDETPIFVNLTATINKPRKEEGIKSSMEALLSNPENQKLLKKKKK